MTDRTQTPGESSGPEARAHDDHTVEDIAMSSEEVRDKALTGSLFVAARGLAVRVLALGGSIVLARMLAPEEFGWVALGLVVFDAAAFFTGGGLGGALIRRPEPPRVRELRALLGLQLLGAVVLSGAVALIALNFGTAGQVIAVMVAAVPVLVLRVPGAIQLERALNYRNIVIVELTESVVYYAWAITTVAVGWGVWGLATALIARAAAGSSVMIAVSPKRVLRPVISFAEVRGLLGFGLKFQAVGLSQVVFTQLFNAGVAAIASFATLGQWALAKRIFDTPGVLFTALWRVSFPAMSRLAAAGEELRPTVERALGRAGVVCAILALGMVGGGPELVPLIFGSQWAPVSDLVPFGALSMMVGIPVSVSTSGYLYAMDDPGAVLRSGILTGSVILIVTCSLLPVIGLVGIGVGMVAGSATDAFMLGRAAKRHSGAHFLRNLALPFLAAVLAGGAGWFAASTPSSDVAGVFVGIAVAEALFGLIIVMFNRPLALDMVGLFRRVVLRDPVPA